MPSEAASGGGYGGIRRPKPKVRKRKPVSSKGQVRRAREQERQYESQGKSVEKQADRQRSESVSRQQEKQHESQGRHVEKRANEQRTLRRRMSPPPRRKQTMVVNIKDVQRDVRARKAETLQKAAPVLKALEQTTRPLHAVAAAERVVIKNFKEGNIRAGRIKSSVVKDVGEAAVKGLKNEDKSTYDDVLGDLGVPKGKVRSAAAFTADVLGDPLTYVSAGTGSVVRKAALDAAKKAEKKALKAGLTREQAARMGQRAARQTEKRAKTSSRGVTVSVGGKELPGVRRGSAAVGRSAGRVTGKSKTVRRVRDRTRRVGAEANANVRPDNLTRAEFAESKRAARSARAGTNADVRRAKNRGAAFRKAIGKADREIIDAVEAGTWRKLPEGKRQVAKRYVDELKYARRLERRAGIPVKKREGYVPHVVKDKAAEEGAGSVGGKTIRPSFSKARKEDRTLAQIRQTDPGKYVEDAPALLTNRLVEGGIARRKAELNRRLADMGRRVKKGMEVDPSALRDKGEAVFHIKGSNVRELDLVKNSEHKRELQRFIDGDSAAGGQYVVLNSQAANRALKGSKVAERGEIEKIIDKGQGGWKWLSTIPNPGFHVRNFAGGIQNAYLYAPGHKLPLNLAQAAKVLGAHGSNQEAARALGGEAATKGAISTKRYGKVSLSEVADRLEKAGAIRGGFVGREIPELVGDAATKPITKVRNTGKAGRVSRAFGRAPKNIEDLPRAATAIEALKRGATWEEAAEVAAKFHFDYADLTPIERRFFRRLMPFYTFSARNIPLQLKSYFQKPGKFAQYQKIREEFANYFDIDLDEWEEGLEEHEQRSAPIPVKWKGKTFALSLGPSGLPLTDLNEIPAGTDPAEWADEWISRGMSLVTPGVKSPVELWANFSFFFRDEIERETGPLVPAPSIVTSLPKSIQKKLGVVDDYVDRRTGKKGPGWPAKVDYIASQLSPGPLGAAKRLTTQSERQGQDTGTKALSYAGVRLIPPDPLTKQINDLYEERAELGKKRAALNQRGMNADNRTPEWSKVNSRYNEIDDEIAALRRRRGDKLVPRRGRPKSKVRRSTSAPSSSGGFFGGSSSGSSSSGGFFD